MSKHKVPGAVIGIVKDDSLVNVVPFGFADVQNQSKVQSGTSFELGSLTKQFTAAAIVLLQQEGKLSIEDYIYKYFPECPEHWKEIKIKHLIWHTSGLPGMFPHDAFTEHSFTGYNKMSPNDLDLMMQLNTVSKENAIKSIITDSLDTKPGTHYNYSDVGYLVLGIIIDNVSGGYREYLQSHIFQPCGMSSTYLLDQERVVPNQARGYSLKNDQLINIMRFWDYEIPSFFGVFSTVEDLYKWDVALSRNSILNPESTNFLFSCGLLEDGSKINYGGGWEVNKINGTKIISHDGVTGTRMVKIPSERLSVIILTNLGYNGNDFVDPFSISSEILNLYGVETTINKSHVTAEGYKVVQYKKKDTENLVGMYSTQDKMLATIKLEDSILYYEFQGEEFELALLENSSWLVLNLPYEYIFTLEENGTKLVSNYGREFFKTK